MKALFFFLAIYLFGQSFIFAQSFASPLSPRTTNYDIKLTLDTQKKQIHATQKVTFKNPSADTIWTLPFHLYYNAFKNNKTTFLTESQFSFIAKVRKPNQQSVWSWIEVQELRDAQGNDLSDRLHYTAVDDHNPADHTVLELQLKEPILPYQSITLDMKWHSQIPHSGVRTGYNKDFFMMAQWFPKLGVYEPQGSRFAKKGSWNCHQYHSNTEYFGEFGVYKVAITVPKEFVVGASGFLVKEESHQSQKTYHYQAEDVIDFAWAAHPDFVVIKEQWQGIEIKLLILPEQQVNKDRFFNAAKYSLAFFEDYIEKYPYPTLTIICPPPYGLFSGAMEYPTLFTAPTLRLLPPNMRTTQTLTMHELTHQYFMQMLSTNEQEEAWMDEGFTAFFEAKMMDKFYPKGVFYSDYLGINIGSAEYRRGRFFNSANTKIGALSMPSWHFKHGHEREIFYGKGAVMLQTLEGLVGDICMQKIIQTYFQRWKFKHPCRHDFIAIVKEVVAKEHDSEMQKNIQIFIDQAINNTLECDYTIHTIQNYDIEEKLGFFESIQQVFSPQQKPTIKESKVVLYRLGEMIVPQDVRIIFDNGDIVLEKWDGKARSFDFTYQGKRKIVSAEIDPSFKIALDKNLINNSYTTQPQTTGISRYFTSFMTWMQGVMLTASALV